ncbi:MAG: flippase-like domain-containing protein [Chitinophagaceae bacterium]|nr:flippase-like domain-containing protein [Chitinophagaceae bacterium]
MFLVTLPPMNVKWKRLIQYLLFLLIGFLFIWLSLKNITQNDIRHIRYSLQSARYGLILPVFVLLMLSHYIRALRWKLLFEASGVQSSTINTFFAVMAGYLVNQGVPRLGEVVKCTLLSRYEKAPFEKLIGTVITERLVDSLSFFIILFVTFAIQPELYSKLNAVFFNGSEKKQSGLLAVLLFIGFLLLVFTAACALWLIVKRKNISELKTALRKIARNIWKGISSILHLKKRVSFLFFTLLIWFLYFISGYIGFYAFQETMHFGIKEAFSVLSAGSIGMIASPGGIGAYAFMIQKTLPLYGLNEVTALAFGWILWIVTTGVIIIGGLISFALIPYYNKSKKSNLESA